MDRSEGERRAAKRPKDQPESEGSRASRSRRSVTGEKRGAPGAGQQRNTQTKKQGGPRPGGIFRGVLSSYPSRRARSAREQAHSKPQGGPAKPQGFVGRGAGLSTRPSFHKTIREQWKCLQ